MTHHRQVRPKGPWTDEAILRESERWVHVPPSGVRVEDAAHLLVHPGDWRSTGRVWRSWPDRAGAEALIPQAIEETRAVGGTGLVWHTGDAVSPPFMDDALAQHGFEKTEDLDVLAFELGADPEPNLPVPHDVNTRLVRDEDDLRLANVVEAGVFPASTWGEADTRASTYAGSRNSMPIGRGVRTRTASRAPSGIWSSSAAAARGRRSRVPRAWSWTARRSGRGAPGRSRGIGAGAPTAPS